MTPTDPELVTSLRGYAVFTSQPRLKMLCTQAADALEAAEARVQQLEAALQECCAVWLATADDSDSGLKATIYRECADEIDALVGRADTQEPAHET